MKHAILRPQKRYCHHPARMVCSALPSEVQGYTSTTAPGVVFPSVARVGGVLESLAVKASETSQYQTQPLGLVRTLL